MSVDRQYQHPGYAFLHCYGSLQSEADVLAYVEFLRTEAKLGAGVPTDLSKVYRHFGMPEPKRVPLDQDQQGILLDSNRGLVLIRSEDSLARQRFTEGHELMEFLFDAQADVGERLGSPRWLTEDYKEVLCDRGAAELLMPSGLFLQDLRDLGVEIGVGKQLAGRYQTSLVATLMRMVELCSSNCALMVWRQGTAGWDLWWSRVSGSWSGGFVPRDRGIELVDLGAIGVVRKRMGIVPLVEQIIPATVETMLTNMGGWALCSIDRGDRQGLGLLLLEAAFGKG
ncbi:MAG: ImmA/IrrE family metallo-endopeptidase [Alkalinema sp. RU_4_3]|nr:ImmA/IrrE family metallo-endopeptidase [Alkalinema sp. RU_4_3]